MSTQRPSTNVKLEKMMYNSSKKLVGGEDDVYQDEIGITGTCHHVNYKGNGIGFVLVWFNEQQTVYCLFLCDC